MLTLPSELTIETASAFAETLLQNVPLHEKTQITLDAAALEAITTPGLQVLLSLNKSLQTKEGSLHIINSTPVVQDIFKDCGLHFLLEAS